MCTYTQGVIFVTGFSNEVRQLIRERSGGVCEIQAVCQGRAASTWQIHHRRPRGMGGTKRPETNQAACGLGVCGDCHRLAESQREMALANGWLVRQNQTPATIPLLYRHRWCLLDNDGGVTEAPCVCGEIETPGGWYPNMCRCADGD
jgi:5-methylcytosine-specific restriction protein A